MSDLDIVLAGCNKHYGKPIINKASGIKFPETGRISSGSLAFDLESGGGYARGKINMLIATESAGKTSLALKAVVEAQKQKLRTVFVDVEGTFDNAWAKHLGVDLDKLDVALPENGEQAMDIVEAVVGTDDCGLIVLDSIAALCPKIELEESMEDAPEKLGNKATLLNRSMRRLVAVLNKISENGERNQTTILLINHFRFKIGAYGPPETYPGGQGIKQNSSIIAELRRGNSGEWIEEERNGEKVRIGQMIKFKFSKNKTFTPFRTGSTCLYIDGPLKGQLDKSQEVYTYGALLGLIKVEGQMTYLDDKKLRGRDNAIQYLRENIKTQDRLEQEIRKAYFGIKK
jgi:recombination protein RecA